MRKEIELKNRVDELKRLSAFVDDISKELHLSSELQMNLTKIISELNSKVGSNIITAIRIY